MSSIFLLALAHLFLAPPAKSAETAADVIKKVNHRERDQSEQVELQMHLQNADGSSRDADRSLLIQARYTGNGDSKMLITFQAPSGIRGTKILTLKSGDETGQWIYLPTVRKASRVNSDQDVEGILDSDLSYGDIKDENTDEYKYSMSDSKGEAAALALCHEPAYSIVAVSAGSSSSYSKRVLAVSRKKYVICAVSLFDKDENLAKKIENASFKKVGSSFRPVKTVVTSFKDGKEVVSKTILTYGNWRIGGKLAEGMFSVNNLAQ